MGVGQRRGLFTPGEIIILVYNSKANAAITVQSMRGYSIFVHFKEMLNYTGLSLEELRRLGLEADRHDLKLWRIFFRYKPQKLSKQKGALIQAVEAVAKKMASEISDVPAIQEFLAAIPSSNTISEKDNAGQY